MRIHESGLCAAGCVLQERKQTAEGEGTGCVEGAVISAQRVRRLALSSTRSEARAEAVPAAPCAVAAGATAVSTAVSTAGATRDTRAAAAAAAARAAT